jgi:apolipoprotein N-acyltransferase
MRKAAGLALAVVVSAVLLVASLPPVDIAPLGFVCLAPLFVAMRGKGFVWGFVAGLTVALVAALVAWSGVFYERSFVGASPGFIFAGFGCFGFAIGLATAIIGEQKKPQPWLPWVLAAWAVLFETLLLVYLPAHLGLTQYRIFPAMKIASLGGIWAVSYMVWVVNFHLAQGYVTRNRRTMALCGSFLGAYFGVSAFTGFPTKGEMVVGIIQTETSESERLESLNQQASRQGAEMVVWPEHAGDAFAAFGVTDPLKELAAQPGQSPFVTSFNDDTPNLPYNTASIFSKEGESERYAKRKLFGDESSDHGRGTEPVAVKLGDVTYGLNICYDTCFPKIMRETANLPDVSMILVPTLDPIGPYGTVQAFHAAFTTFRAAENGIPVVRADTTAYSMVVDARGVIVAEMGSGIEGVKVAELTPERRNTVYRQIGDWFLWICGFLVVAGLIQGRTSTKKPKGSSLKPKK